MLAGNPFCSSNSASQSRIPAFALFVFSENERRTSFSELGLVERREAMIDASFSLNWRESRCRAA